MKVFITGISGLLGKHVARTCIHNGYHISALVRNKKINNDLPNVSFCHGDLSDENTLTEYLDATDVIIHCAADTSMFARRNKKQEQTNITGLKNIIESAKKTNVKRFIYISSANTILHGNAGNPGKESAKLNVKNSRLPYINSKILAEEILLNEFRLNNFPVVIINPTFILGPEDFKPSSGKMILAAIKKQLFFYPSGGKNIVDVRDLAQVIVNAVSMARLGENYLVCNENISYKELVQKVGKYAHLNIPGTQLPDFLGRIIGSVGTFAEYLTGKSFAVNHKTIKLSFENHYYSAEKAKNELGFSPRSIDQTIQDTVNWFKNEYVPNKKS